MAWKLLNKLIKKNVLQESVQLIHLLISEGNKYRIQDNPLEKKKKYVCV